MTMMLKQRLMWIAWPGFLVAAVLEMLVFAFVDPGELHGPAGAPLGVSRVVVYSAAFFAFWLAAMASSALTTLLSRSPFETQRCPLPVDGRPDACPKPQPRPR